MQLMRKQVPYIAIFVVVLQLCLAAEQKTNLAEGQELKSPVPSKNQVSAKDEIYIDEDGIEGSGSRASEVHEDLEKEDENSGSGFGPDDEDLAVGRHHIKQNKQKTTTPKYSTDHSVHKKPVTSTDLEESGSGDGSHLHFDEEDDDDDDDDDDTEVEAKSNAPTDGAGDFTTEVKQTEVDPSTIGDIIDEEEPEIDDTEEDDVEDRIDPSIFEGTKVNAEVPRHGLHDVDLTTEKESALEEPKDIDDDDDDDGSSEEKRKEVVVNNGVSISDTREEDGTASFFAQPGILAAVIGGAVVGLLCAILVVMFIVYRMRKKDEGSYALDNETKRAPASYAKSGNNREFFA